MLLYLRSVTKVSWSLSFRKPLKTTVLLAGRPLGCTVATWKYFASLDVFFLQG
jgi:hypothetical protein